MKRMSVVLRSVVTLILLGSNVPAWAGVYACVDGSGSGSHGLACIKACATATALFTQDGKLPVVGRGSCHVKVQAVSATTLASQGPSVSAPSHVILALAVTGVSPIQELGAFPLHSRGSPPGSAYLSSQHAFANGPPTLL